MLYSSGTIEFPGKMPTDIYSNWRKNRRQCFEAAEKWLRIQFDLTSGACLDNNVVFLCLLWQMILFFIEKKSENFYSLDQNFLSEKIAVLGQ